MNVGSLSAGEVGLKQTHDQWLMLIMRTRHSRILADILDITVQETRKKLGSDRSCYIWFSG